MIVIPHHRVFIRMPRCATTHVHSFFEDQGLCQQHSGHMHSTYLCNSFKWLDTFITLRDPIKWYPSFWAYFVEGKGGTHGVQTNPELVAYHGKESFSEWLYRMTVGPPEDVGEHLPLPISFDGRGQGTDCFDHGRFWAEREKQGGGLFTYIARTMMGRETDVVAVGRLYKDLRKVLDKTGFVWCDAYDDWWLNAEPRNQSHHEMKLTAQQVAWVLSADGDIMDQYKLEEGR